MDDDFNAVTMPVVHAKEGDPGALCDSCGNWFIPDPLNAIWTNDDSLPGFCGCGDPGELKGLVRAYLETTIRNDNESFADWYATCEAKCGGKAAYLILAYVCDAKGWTEHGSSINSAWMTSKGEQTLAALRSGA